MIIGLEGPAGSGKTTMARTVAAEIGAVVMEGGIWYRALTYVALKRGVDLTDTKALEYVAARFDLSVEWSPDGHDLIKIDGQDVTHDLYRGEVSGNVAVVARQLTVRAVIDRRVLRWAHSQPKVIFVGRHLKHAFPEAPILRLVIDEDEAERRHLARAGTAVHRVGDRNALDRETAAALGTGEDGVPELDVTHLTPDEQAKAFREFISQIG